MSDSNNKVTSTSAEIWPTANEELTFADVCARFGVDPSTNPVFWDTDLTRRVVIDEQTLDFMGFNGDDFDSKNAQFKRLLHDNPGVEFTEDDDNESGRRHIVLCGIDFEALLVQTDMPRGIEFRALFTAISRCIFTYCDYLSNKL